MIFFRNEIIKSGIFYEMKTLVAIANIIAYILDSTSTCIFFNFEESSTYGGIS